MLTVPPRDGRTARLQRVVEHGKNRVKDLPCSSFGQRLRATPALRPRAGRARLPRPPAEVPASDDLRLFAMTFARRLRLRLDLFA